MSVQAMTWAWKQQLPMGPKAVLVALANHADGDGVCYPGQVRLAEMVGCNDRSVRKFVKHLEAEGLIERTQRRRADGSRTSDAYRLIGYQPENRAGSEREPTGNPCRTNRQTVPGLPAQISGHEPSVEPSEEPSVETPARERAKRDQAFTPESVDIPEHVDRNEWTAYCQHRREIRKRLTPTATTRLVALLERHPRDANTMLRRSIENGWTGVFELKNRAASNREPDMRPEKYQPTTAADLLRGN